MYLSRSRETGRRKPQPNYVAVLSKFTFWAKIKSCLQTFPCNFSYSNIIFAFWPESCFLLAGKITLLEKHWLRSIEPILVNWTLTKSGMYLFYLSWTLKRLMWKKIQSIIYFYPIYRIMFILKQFSPKNWFAAKI